ncbi:sterol O-acyltransferase 2-like [Anopheles funestus]|uniref:sterol O-acyltransferase 2-like n=1 Tax=Anopheles funestus TaxID=62324 RepID=UPI0020C70F83|nr:sterol O-acyltransferase 2-like [Anopheles funestus]
MNVAGSENESSSITDYNDRVPGTTVQNAINSHVQKEYHVEVVKDMAIEKMKQKMHEIVDRMGKDVEKELDFAMDDMFSEVKQFNLNNYERKQLYNGKSSNGTDSQRQNSTLNGKLPIKVFRARNSLLTDMLEIRHIKTIYHIFIVMLIILFLNTLVHDFVDTGSINLGLRPIIAGFGKFHIAVMLWCCMQTSNFLLYPCFRMWAVKRNTSNPGSAGQKCWDWTAIALFILYQWGFFLAAIASHVWFDLPPATGVAYLMEMVRFMMKSHAFVRSSAPKALTSDKNEADFESIHAETSCRLPSFSKYVYFMFAPTLVYRDDYPRTRTIRWRVVARHALEMVGAVFFLSFILERLLTPLYENFGTAQISSGSFVKSLFSSLLPGTLITLCFFYCSLHSCMNIVAELSRFADRMFYRDWWNESTFAGYIRSWNVVVHDWLYTYVYKDCVEHVFCNCRPLATVAVFTFSAVLHEIIMAFTFRFFYPVMFVQLEFLGLLLMFVMKRMGKDVGNVLVWLMISIGNGLNLSLYSMEYYARRNCPDVGTSLVDYLVPVSWFCNGISHNPNWTITAPWSLQ